MAKSCRHDHSTLPVQHHWQVRRATRHRRRMRREKGGASGGDESNVWTKLRTKQFSRSAALATTASSHLCRVHVCGSTLRVMMPSEFQEAQEARSRKDLARDIQGSSSAASFPKPVTIKAGFHVPFPTYHRAFNKQPRLATHTHAHTHNSSIQ